MTKSSKKGDNTKSKKKQDISSAQDASEISTMLKELAEKYPYNLISRAFCEFSKDYKKDVAVARPTPIDKEVYKNFTNACRDNDKDVNVVLESLCMLYSKSGESIF